MLAVAFHSIRTYTAESNSLISTAGVSREAGPPGDGLGNHESLWHNSRRECRILITFEEGICQILRPSLCLHMGGESQGGIHRSVSVQLCLQLLISICHNVFTDLRRESQYATYRLRTTIRVIIVQNLLLLGSPTRFILVSSNRFGHNWGIKSRRTTPSDYIQI